MSDETFISKMGSFFGFNDSNDSGTKDATEKPSFFSKQSKTKWGKTHFDDPTVSSAIASGCVLLKQSLDAQTGELKIVLIRGRRLPEPLKDMNYLIKEHVEDEWEWVRVGTRLDGVPVIFKKIDAAQKLSHISFGLLKMTDLGAFKKAAAKFTMRKKKEND